MSNLPARKRPHPPDTSPNESGGDGSKVKVVVRIRPPNAKESEGNFRIVVQAVDENILVFDPKENNGNQVGRIKGRRDIRKRPNRDLKFAFDRVFGPETSNEDVYKETTNLVISGVLDGYNCSVFAYGATGAGKTFTMLGTKEKPGVMYHTMVDLYARIESIKDNTTCNIAVSYLEVYNETLRDLLMPGNPLPIREDPGKGVVIPGLSLHKPKNAEELLYMLQFGNQHRSQHPTDANAESSRSHAVFQVFVRQQDRTANISTEVRVAKMCLVDLAGSERATVNKNSGSRFREGANINRSLLALGNVINALAENRNKGFVPYRDSKLTRILKDSLGGNCQTVMIAAVSPSSMSFEDTYNTLQYADRAKHIRATLKKNVLNVDFHMAKYGQIVTELRKEISELKSKLKGYEEGITRPVSAPSSSVPPASVGPGMSSSFIGYQRELDTFFTSHIASRSDQLQQEIALRNLQWKLYRKNRSVARVKALGNVDEQARLGNVVKKIAAKSSCLSISVDNSRAKLEQELSQFKDISQSLKQVGNVDSLPEVLGLSLQAHSYGLELEDTKRYLGFTKQVIRCQERELHHNERLVLQLLKLLRNQHFIIKGHNIITSDLEEEYKDIVKKVIGQELTWEDQLDEDQVRGYRLSDMLDLPTLKMKPSPTDLNWKISERKERKTGGANKQTIWPAQLSTDKPSQNSQDEDCQPSKAKRAMLTPSVQQQQVRHDTGKHRQRPPHGHKSKFSSAGRIGHARSLSESNLKRNAQNGAGKQERNSFLPTNMPLRVLQTNSSSDDISPECDVQMNTRFSKINDTITKAKKFSHLHTKDVTKEETLPAQSCEMKGDNSESLNGTFTIDETESVAPIAIPCIDTDVVSKCSSCSHGVVQSDGQVKSGNVCITCELLRKNGTKINNDGHTLGQLGSNTDCDRDKIAGSNQDDSNASTLVNQSASSQTSLSSTSTLVADLSQNLSGEIDISAIENRNTYYSVDTNDTNRQQGLGSGESTVSKGRPADNSVKRSGFGETVTKTNLYKIIEERSMEKSIPGSNDSTGKQTKAARCINFGDSKEKDCCKTAVINTKTPDRRPLQDVGGSNTPQNDRNSFGCLTSSTDSDLSFEKSLHKQKMSGTRLFEKENCKLLSKFGLPSMTEGSLIINSSGKGKSKMNHATTTPGYMQLTKAHSHRIKHNKSVNSDSDNGPGRVKSANIQRPLVSQMRSKSMSNLSSRSGWQF